MSLRTTIAASFKHMRKKQLRKNDFIYFLTIDRKWMNRDLANRVITQAESEGLIKLNGEYYEPEFDIAPVSIPLGFKPHSDMFESRDYTGELLEKIASARGVDVKDIVSEMNAIISDQFDGHLRVEAAVVLMARKYGVPFEDFHEELKKSLQKSVSEKCA